MLPCPLPCFLPIFDLEEEWSLVGWHKPFVGGAYIPAFGMCAVKKGTHRRLRNLRVEVGSVFAHMAENAMYAPPAVLHSHPSRMDRSDPDENGEPTPLGEPSRSDADGCETHQTRPVAQPSGSGVRRESSHNGTGNDRTRNDAHGDKCWR